MRGLTSLARRQGMPLAAHRRPPDLAVMTWRVTGSARRACSRGAVRAVVVAAHSSLIVVSLWLMSTTGALQRPGLCPVP